MGVAQEKPNRCGVAVFFFIVFPWRWYLNYQSSCRGKKQNQMKEKNQMEKENKHCHQKGFFWVGERRFTRLVLFLVLFQAPQLVSWFLLGPKLINAVGLTNVFPPGQCDQMLRFIAKVAIFDPLLRPDFGLLRQVAKSRNVAIFDNSKFLCSKKWN